MRITLLNTTFAINTQVASNLIESKHHIFYLDQRGQVNKISIKSSDWMDKLFAPKTTKYKFTQ
jgi:hypothetical protein